MSTDSEHLKWIEDRLVNVYGESPNVDFIIRLRKIRAALDEGEAPKMDHKCEEGVCLICHPIEPNKPPAAAGHCPGCRLKPRCPGIPAAQPTVSEEDLRLLVDSVRCEHGHSVKECYASDRCNDRRLLITRDLAARLRREGK